MKKFIVFVMSMVMIASCVMTGVAVTASGSEVSTMEKNALSNLSYSFPREGVATIPNGTMVAPDPWVVKKDNYYYFCYSGGDGVCVASADSLDKVANNGNKVYTAPAGTMYSAEYWAPELHYINGEWYIYVAADDGNNNNHRMYVLKGTSQDPTQPFVMVGKITDSTNKWAIDGTILQTDDGRLYFVWSGWPGDTNYVQNIYIAQMSSPTQISSNRVLLSTPSYSWETVDYPDVNEGPAVITHSGRWGKVNYNGMVGWINLDYTDAVSGVTDRSNYTANTQYRVTSDGLNLRASHDAGSTLLATLPKDTVVTTLEISKTYHIVYSASGSWTDDYCMGVLTLRDGNFLNAASWTKSSTPLMSKASGAYGPGHCSFTKSYDNTEDWIVYHATAVSGSGWDNRTVRFQKVDWNGDFPVVAAPQPANTTVQLRYDALRRVDVGTDFYANIVHKNGLYVTAVDSNLQAETATGNNNQLWKFTRNADGTYLITSAADSRAIDVSGGSGHYNNGNNIGLWTATGDHPQKWSLMIDDQGYFHFKSHGGKTVFDLYNNDNIPGTNIHLWEEHDGDAQRFLLKYSSLNLGDEFDATLKMDAADLYIQSNNSVVSIGTPTGGAEQSWHFTRNGDGTYYISNEANGKVLDVANGGTVNGTAVIAGSKANTRNQRWTIHSSTNGTYTLQTVCGGRVLDIPSANLVNGANFQIYDRNNTDAQRIVITLIDRFVLKDDAKEVLTDKYLKTITEGDTAKNVSGKFKCAVTVLNSKGQALADGDQVGTGCKVVKYSANQEIANAVDVVLAGDADGDAYVSTSDYMLIKLFIINAYTVEDCFDMACDYNSDDDVSTTDLMLMKIHFKNQV